MNGIQIYNNITYKNNNKRNGFFGNNQSRTWKTDPGASGNGKDVLVISNHINVKGMDVNSGK